MQPLFAVHNNVSLLSVNIAPSTFLAALTLAFVFLSLYLPRLPSLPRLFSFGRRRTSDAGEKGVVLNRHQRFARDLGDGYDNFLNVQQWRNREDLTIDWRHRQLPPLPPPPFRPLLPERGYVEAREYHEEEELILGSRKRPSNRKDRGRSSKKAGKEPKDRELETKKEKKPIFERFGLFSRRDKKSSKPSALLKGKSGNRSITPPPTAVSTQLVAQTRRHHRADFYDPYDQPSDKSTDCQEQGRNTSQKLVDDDSSNNAAGWLSFGVLGPLISRLRPVQQPAANAVYLTPPRTPVAPVTPATPISTFTPKSEREPSDETESTGYPVYAGGYSPPAWRRLENGDRSSGFWRKSDNILGSPTQTTPMRFTYEQLQEQQQQQQQYSLPHPSVPPHVFTSHLQQHFQRRKEHRADRMFASRGSSPGFDSEEDAMVDEVLGPEDDNTFDNYGHGGRYADDTILERAMRTRLPGSMSPEKERSPDPEQVYPSPASRMDEMRLKAMESIQEEAKGMLGTDGLEHGSPESYIRLTVRSEVHQTGNVQYIMSVIRGMSHDVTRSWARIIISIVVGILSFAAMRTLSHSAGLRPVPDLVKVAGVARSFEPLIYYSENGVAQVHDLEATGVAVWDLGESVRLSNLTSAPIIVQELDELSDTLKALAMELTRFFANIDGDIDGILIVMDWARRELSRLQEPPASASASLLLMKPLTAMYDNVYSLLTCAGLLENAATGSPTAVGSVTTTLFGMSGPQRTRATLHRTFHEFLVVLEEAVATELQHSLALFALFENVDRQFLNLVRTVAREASVQDERHADLLSGLWTRILGPSAAATAKYEQNRELLRDVREKTVRNKGVLVEHNHRLLALKTSLESLRRKLVSPLVRSVNSSTLTLDEQIRGLEDVGGYLHQVRSRQKEKLMETLYGAGTQRVRIGWNSDSNGDAENTNYREATRAPLDEQR